MFPLSSVLNIIDFNGTNASLYNPTLAAESLTIPLPFWSDCDGWPSVIKITCVGSLSALFNSVVACINAAS